MSRGGKLAPEVNRYVLNLDGKERALTFVSQSFVRQESKVRRVTSRYCVEEGDWMVNLVTNRQ
jgi:hypothetical protein